MPNIFTILEKQKNTLIYAGMTIVMIMMLAMTTINSFLITQSYKDRNHNDIGVIEESIRKIAELATLTYSYSDVGIFEEQKTMSLFGKEIGIYGTRKSFIITYDGEMKLGIDLSQLSIAAANGVLNVELPLIQIFSHVIAEDSIKLLNEETGLFSSFSIMDYADFIVEQKNKMETRAIDSGLWDQAQENAKLQIKAFISAIPGIAEEYKIRFTK